MQMYATSRAQPDLQPIDRRPAQDWGELNVLGVARAFGRDQEIYAEGDKVDGLFKVASGAVRIVRLLRDGRRQVLDFYVPGDIFGVELGDVRGAAAEALVDTTLIVVRGSALAADPATGGRLTRCALRCLQRSQAHLVTLGRRTAAEKVARFLIDLADRTGGADDLALPMSRQDIADFLGLTIETVSRTFSQLQAQGLIAVAGCRAVVLRRRAALAAMCE